MQMSEKRTAYQSSSPK